MTDSLNGNIITEGLYLNPLVFILTSEVQNLKESSDRFNTDLYYHYKRETTATDYFKS